MSLIRKFFTQPSRKYRNFQIVFTILTLNFAIPSVSYIFTPDSAIGSFASLNSLLGGKPYTVPENAAFFWRYLGIANVMTLAFMCFLMQVDLKKFIPVLIPLVFMKGTAATFWLIGFFRHPIYPVFLAAAVLDYFTTASFLYFSISARREIESLHDDNPVPPPLFSGGEGMWFRFERKWRDSLLSAMIPPIPEGSIPGIESIDLSEFHTGLDRNAPIILKLGFRLSVWILTFLPVLTFHSLRPFHKLPENQKDRFLKKVSRSKSFILRQMVETLKLIACMGYFSDRETRSLFGETVQ